MKYFAFALLLAGCGAEIDDLYGRSETGEGAGSGTGAAPSTSTNGGGPNNSSSNAGGAPSSNNSSSSTSSSNTNNSSTSTNMTTDVSATNATTGPDPSSSQTTSGPPDGIFVQCGDSLCDVSDGNVCCIGSQGQNCVPDEACGGFNQVPASCDDPFDCDGGDVCCGFVDNSSYYEEIRCASDCEWPDRTFCTPGGPACEPIFSGGVLQDAFCAQSTILPDGYLVCKL